MWKNATNSRSLSLKWGRMGKEYFNLSLFPPLAKPNQKADGRRNWMMSPLRQNRSDAHKAHGSSPFIEYIIYSILRLNMVPHKE